MNSLRYEKEDAVIKDFLERRQIRKLFSKYISKEANKSNYHGISYMIVNTIDYVAMDLTRGDYEKAYFSHLDLVIKLA